MAAAAEKLTAAMQKAQVEAPKVGHFPYLAECLRQAGATKNIWQLPSAQSMFWTADGIVVIQNAPLLSGLTEVLAFDEAKLIAVLRADQAGETTFPEFLAGAWQAGCISYTVDFNARTVIYYGAQGEEYLETYPAVTL